MTAINLSSFLKMSAKLQPKMFGVISTNNGILTNGIWMLDSPFLILTFRLCRMAPS